MSPEALKNNIYSMKNDIWSIGIILYYLMAKKLPFPQIGVIKRALAI